MLEINVNDTITCDEVEKIYKKFPNEEIIMTMPNTKMQSEKRMYEIAKRFPDIIFSVTGGLDPKKGKYDNYHYQLRTYYSAMELSKIISIFRNIEKQIDISWTETQKAMFIYKEICNKMEYSENNVNGKDCSRNLCGLLYNKAVCSGFAMIYKEALDRIGIECHYQNQESYHSWNIAKLDGKYRALELTWDVNSKKENGCEFKYFNQDIDFYNSEAHDISFEKEEKKFPIVPYTFEELVNDYKIIIQKRIKKIKMPINPNIGFVETHPIQMENSSFIIRKNLDGSIIIRNKENESKSFLRNDGTHFALVKMKNNKDNYLNKFLVIEENKNGIQMAKIFSEENLVHLPNEYDSIIANGLLSKKRLKTKICDYNGYVGYIGTNSNIYYDTNIEKSINIIR